MTIHDLFDGLDRCAPCDAASLTRACAGLAPTAQVLDAGCGTGADLPSLLALVPEGQVTAVDLAAPFIAAIRMRYPQVRAEIADMTDPPGGQFDLIWSGGAIYGPGIKAALAAWRAKLAPGGRVVFTDLVLRSRDVSPEVAEFFAAEKAVLRDVPGLQAEVAAAGWRCLDGFWLPESAWEAYYLPLEQRLDTMAHDPETAELVAGFRSEIALWRRHGAEYGYYLIVAVPQ
jgi:SAM-dependent methyltransferase